MTEKPATKRIRIKLGDVFALPLEDGSFGVAHIGAIAHRLAYRTSTTCGSLQSVSPSLVTVR
jgi:hypothetical protein